MTTAKQKAPAVNPARTPPDAWEREARRLLKGAMHVHGYESYKSLARALEKAGEERITEASLALRINRGTFSMAFALRVLRVMGVKSLDISHVKVHKPGGDH